MRELVTRKEQDGNNFLVSPWIGLGLSPGGAVVNSQGR